MEWSTSTRSESVASSSSTGTALPTSTRSESVASSSSTGTALPTTRLTMSVALEERDSSWQKCVAREPSRPLAT
uniref:Uncharacterized protein n=1 Tax=Zea mays TaxID=4577 RepID=C4J0A0_MAIZE|nr:unknown [Zea mays]